MKRLTKDQKNLSEHIYRIIAHGDRKHKAWLKQKSIEVAVSYLANMLFNKAEK